MMNERDFVLPDSVETWSATRLRALAEMAVAFSSSLDLPHVLDTVVRLVGRELGGIVALYLADPPDTNTLLIHAAFDSDTGQRDYDPWQILDNPLKKGIGMSGRAFDERQPVNVDFRHAHHPDFTRAIDAKLSVGCAVPLIAKASTPIGVLTAARLEPDAAPYSQADIDFLVAVAAPAALAVSNARLYAEAERSREFLTAVIDMAPTGITIWDAAGQTVMINQKAAGFRGEKVDLPYNKHHAPAYQLYDQNNRLVPPSETPIFRAWQDHSQTSALLTFQHDDPAQSPYHARIKGRWLPNGYTVGILEDMNKEIEAQREAQRQANHLQLILEAISDGVLIYDAQHRLTYINTAAQRLLGISDKDAYMRLPLADHLALIHSRWMDDVPMSEENATVLRVLAGETVSDFFTRIKRIDTGEERVMRNTAAPLRATVGGPVTGVVLTFNDLTERQRQSDELQRAHRDMRQLFENLPVALTTLSYPDLHVTRINSLALTYIGKSEEEVIGTCLNLHGQTDIEHIERLRDALISSSQNIVLREFPITPPDGTATWWNITLSPRYSNDPTPTIESVISAGVDVTAEVIARRQVEAEQARMDAFFQATPDAVIVINAEGTVSTFNQAAAELLHITPGMAHILPDQGGPYRVLDLNGTPLPIGDRVRDRVARGETVRERAVLIHRLDDDTIREVRINAAPIRLEATDRIEYIVMSVRDVTETRRMEQQLVEQEAQVAALTHANALKADFIRIVSHELRTPLTGVLGFAELMTMRRLPQEVVHTFAQKIQISAERMRAIIDEFLNLQRLEAGREEFTLESIALADLLNEAGQIVPDTTHRLILNMPETPITVCADHNALLRVLENLLGNAVKYSPDASTIEVGMQVEGGEAVISIRDHGIGIPPDAMPFIFERFFRVRRVDSPQTTPGAGLGLAIAHQIVAQHSGRLWAESSGIPGEGSTFYLALPLPV